MHIMVNELKAQLRKSISAEISCLPDDYVSASDNGIFMRVVSLAEFAAARNILIYCSVKREPATHEIAEKALSMGKTIAYPFCFRGGIMQARVVKSITELRPAVLGIPAPPDTAPIMAPEELGLIIVPALAYDNNGFRIGYGGGYYDRFLRGIPAFTVGLARERLMKDNLPTQPHDIPVKCIITEDRVFMPKAIAM